MTNTFPLRTFPASPAAAPRLLPRLHPPRARVPPTPPHTSLGSRRLPTIPQSLSSLGAPVARTLVYQSGTDHVELETRRRGERAVTVLFFLRTKAHTYRILVSEPFTGGRTSVDHTERRQRVRRDAWIKHDASSVCVTPPARVDDFAGAVELTTGFARH